MADAALLKAWAGKVTAVLGTGCPRLLALHAALPGTSVARGSKLRPADVANMPVTNRKDKNNLEEAATCFLCQELGDGAGGEGAEWL